VSDLSATYYTPSQFNGIIIEVNQVIHRPLSVWFLVFFSFINAHSQGQDRSIIDAGKSASFLVTLPGDSSYATAFCIHESGIFVTNHHVVESMAIGDTLTLTMNSGSDDQKTFDVKLIRQNEKSDLAILRYEASGEKFPTLKLCKNPSVFETMNVSAFGFPFGIGLAVEEGASPSISVSVGKITAVRRDKKEIQLIQLDATLNPGNSGGAVVDEKGEVIGVVSFGVAASGVNFAIPVEKLTSLLETPDVDLIVPNFDDGNLTKSREVEVVLKPFVNDLPEATVEFWLKKGDDKPMRFDLSQKNPNRFVGTVKGPDADAQKPFNCRFEFSNGKIEAKIADQKLTIAEKEYQLSEIRKIEILNETDGSQAQVTLASGVIKKSPAVSLPTVKIDLGNYPASINLTKAKRFEIEKDEATEPISYIVIVKNAGKEIYRASSEAMDDVSNIASSETGIPFFPQGARKATSLAGGSKVVPVPGTITDVVQARGGELLLITLGLEKKLVVLDLVSASIVKIIPLASDDVLVAGTMDHIIVMDRSKNIIERHAINSFKREIAVKPPFVGVVKSITAGSASQGPILVHKSEGTDALAQADFIAIDLKTFRELPIKMVGSGHYSSFRDVVHVRASANGKVFGMWATSHSPQGIQSMLVTEKQFLTKYEHDSVGHVVPTADGTHIVTGVRGVFTTGLKNISKSSNRSYLLPCVPTSHPRFYVSIPADPRAQVNLGNDAFKGRLPGIHEISSEAPLLNLPDLQLNSQGSGNDGGWAKDDFSLDKRVYLNLALNRLVSVPLTNDSVILQQFDFNAELKKSDLDYFFVSSIPGRTFLPGKTYSYQITMESKKGKAKFELANGPDKMEVSSKGKITWKVPPNFKDETVDVIVSITDGDSAQTYESFTIYKAMK